MTAARPAAPSSRRDLIDVALGKAPADTYIEGGELVDVSTAKIYRGAVAIKGDRIAAVGDVAYTRGSDTETIDAAGRYLVPGLVETHVHSFHSYLGVDEFVRVMLSHGVTSAADDLYGLGIVGGRDAIRFFKDAFEPTPLRLIFLVPTLAYLQNRYIGLTPAPGISVEDMFEMLDWDGCRGLSETPFPPVVEKYPEILDLFEAALERGKVITGHAPDIGPRELQAYVAMGAYTDHESVEHLDALTKARAGMKVLLRQSSIGHNTPELARLYTEQGIDPRCLAFSTDVASADKLASSGAIDEHIRVAIAHGIPPIEAIQMATINGAEIFGLHHDVGSISPGRYADLLLVDDLASFRIDSVMAGGQLVLDGGDFVAAMPGTSYPAEFYGTVRLAKAVTAEDLTVRVAGTRGTEVRVIGVRDGSVLTEERRLTLQPLDGMLPADTANDILHIAMVDRFGKGEGTGIGLGFVQGFALRAGAIASSVSCECSNPCAVGADADDMAIALNRLAEIGGGMIVVRDREVVASVELPILGQLSEDPLPDAVRKFERTYEAIADLGCTLASPWSQLEFCFAGGSDGVLKLCDEGLLSVRPSNVSKVDVIVDG